jgi:hypothetical protein
MTSPDHDSLLQDSVSRVMFPQDSVYELADQIVSFAGRLASSMCRWLLLIAAFDAAAGYESYGMAGTASWLGHWCGLSRRTAAEHVRVARVLAREPTLVEAMQAGRLSYSQVRAISRIAEPDGHALVTTLIGVSEHGTVAQLESVIAGLRTADNADPSAPPPEYLRSAFDEGSHWRLTARLAPEDGALIDAALAKIICTLPPETPNAQPADDQGPAGPPHAERPLQLVSSDSGREPRERPAQVRALIRLAEIGLAALDDATEENHAKVDDHSTNDHRSPDGARADERPEGRYLRGDERAAIVIHLDADKLPPEIRDGAGAPGTLTELADLPAGRLHGGPGLPDRVVRRLLCDGRIRTVVERRTPDGRRTPLDLGRSRRVVSAKLFRALLLRDGGCRHPACGSTRDLHAHHVRHWIAGGPTNLDNLVLLCAHHHAEHHDGRLSVTKISVGQFRFAYNDRHIPNAAAVDRIDLTGRQLELEASDVASRAARGRSAGDRLDRPYAVATLAAIRDRERGTPSIAIATADLISAGP